MPVKSWAVDVDKKLNVIFRNQWDFTMRAKETLMINGETVSESAKTPSDSGKSLISGHHSATVTVDGKVYNVLVKCGSKWPGIFLGCHIYVNGDLVGGDIKSKLMFVD